MERECAIPCVLCARPVLPDEELLPLLCDDGFDAHAECVRRHAPTCAPCIRADVMGGALRERAGDYFDYPCDVFRCFGCQDVRNIYECSNVACSSQLDPGFNNPLDDPAVALRLGLFESRRPLFHADHAR